MIAAGSLVHFTSLARAQAIIEAWRFDYNQRRPHSSLGHLTPNEFAGQRQVLQTVEEAVCSSQELSRNGANVNTGRNKQPRWLDFRGALHNVNRRRTQGGSFAYIGFGDAYSFLRIQEKVSAACRPATDRKSMTQQRHRICSGTHHVR